MNSLAFIASVVGSLAVPVTIVVVLILFRGPLTEFLGRIISYEGLGQKVNFGQKLAEAEKSVNKAVAQAPEEVPDRVLRAAEAKVQGAVQTPLGVIDVERPADDHALRKITSTQRKSQDVDLLRAGLVEVAELATSNPSFVVIKSWEEFNGVLEELVAAAFPGNKKAWTWRMQLLELRKQGHVGNSFWVAFQELQELRNSVAHGRHNPTAGEAVTYLESIRELAAIAGSSAARIAGRRAAEKAIEEAIQRTRVPET